MDQIESKQSLDLSKRDQMIAKLETVSTMASSVLCNCVSACLMSFLV